MGSLNKGEKQETSVSFYNAIISRMTISMSKPKIALFGYYNYDNWGDNFMALVFSSYLKNKDAVFSVFIEDAKKRYYTQHIEHISSSLEEFLEDKDLVIYGGGGALVPRKHDSTSFCGHLKKLLEICRRKKLPIYAISVGGIGNHSKGLVPPVRKDLFDALEYVTVRNPQDLLFLKKFNKNGRFYHDILWLTPEFFEIKKSWIKNSGSGSMFGT